MNVNAEIITGIQPIVIVNINDMTVGQLYREISEGIDLPFTNFMLLYEGHHLIEHGLAYPLLNFGKEHLQINLLFEWRFGKTAQEWATWLTFTGAITCGIQDHIAEKNVIEHDYAIKRHLVAHRNASLINEL